jgi:hypothetical protein
MPGSVNRIMRRESQGFSDSDSNDQQLAIVRLGSKFGAILGLAGGMVAESKLQGNVSCRAFFRYVPYVPGVTSALGALGGMMTALMIARVMNAIKERKGDVTHSS